jgi:hypothetical protein
MSSANPLLETALLNNLEHTETGDDVLIIV